MPKLLRFLLLGRKSDATPLAALLLGAFIYCAFAASHHNLAASQSATNSPGAVVLSIPTVVDPSLPTLPLVMPKASVPAMPPPQMQPAPATEPQAPVLVSVAHTEELASVFDSHNYTLSDIRSGEKTVPPLALDRFPNDLGQVVEVEKRKMLFIQGLLPIVLQTNERIVVERRRLNWLRDAIAQDTAILPGDQLWLAGMAERYGTGSTTIADLDELLRRVDVVPPSLAIAQAITESGWGTSYPARVGNALFGQFHFTVRGGRTAVGEARPGTFQMRAFATLSDAVEGYVLNLNTHPAYRGFRLQRAKLRSTGDALDGYVLVNTLQNYSELGVQYINAVRLIMRTEKLTALDDAKLDVF